MESFKILESQHLFTRNIFTVSDSYFDSINSENIFINKLEVSKIIQIVLSENILFLSGGEGRGKTFLVKNILKSLSEEYNYHILYADLNFYHSEKSFDLLLGFQKYFDSEKPTIIAIDNIHLKSHFLSDLIELKEVLRIKNKHSGIIFCSRESKIQNSLIKKYKIKNNSFWQINSSYSTAISIIKKRLPKLADKNVNTWLNQQIFKFTENNGNLRLLNFYIEESIYSGKELTNLSEFDVLEGFLESFINNELNNNDQISITKYLNALSYVASLYQYDIPVLIPLTDILNFSLKRKLIFFQDRFLHFTHTVDAKMLVKSNALYIKESSEKIIARNIVDYLLYHSKLDGEVHSSFIISKIGKSLNMIRTLNNSIYETICKDIVENQRISAIIFKKSLKLLNYLLWFKYKTEGKESAIDYFEKWLDLIKENIFNYHSLDVMFVCVGLEKFNYNVTNFILYCFPNILNMEEYIHQIDDMTSVDYRRLMKYLRLGYDSLPKRDISLYNLLVKLSWSKNINRQFVLRVNEYTEVELKRIINLLGNTFTCDSEFSELDCFVISERLKEIKISEAELDDFRRFKKKLESSYVNDHYQYYYCLSGFIRTLKRNKSELTKGVIDKIVELINNNLLNEKSIHFLMHSYDLNNQKIIDAITSSLNGYGENEKNILKKYYNDFSIKNKNLTGFLPFSIRHLGL